MGPVDEHLDGAAFERGIQVGSAARAVAIPVAECTSAMILPATKGVPTAAREDQQWRRAAPIRTRSAGPRPSATTVGPVGASRTGRRVLEPPRPFGLEVLPGDPFVTADVAGVFGARPAGLAESCTVGDLVSPYARRPPGGVRRAVRIGLSCDLRGLPATRPSAYGAGGQATLLREPAPASAAPRGLLLIKKSTRRKSVRRPY
ncbi:hypothetical protein OG824_32880 [Streptomyces prunicolor]|uniref:hypothetical protein n=1 Tax=Streptomyces prunicolor TaxID=67348 RepID=UPI0022574FEB|nr:hypothetical protein [Streptomyces prunicolor]MCX5240011.1 hypothetical protein [Streptomyces prunicolor]